MQVSNVKNINIWLHELISRLPDHQQYLDVWVQGWYADMFAFNEFQVVMNPYGTLGPDLKINLLNECAYIEVLRIRVDLEEEHTIEQNMRDALSNGLLYSEGSIGKVIINKKTGERRFEPEVTETVRKLSQKISNKYRQGAENSLINTEPYIVAAHSVSHKTDDIIFKLVTKLFEIEAELGGSQRKAISGCLFYNGFVHLPLRKCCNFWKNPNSGNGQKEFMEKLNNLSAPPLFERKP